MSHLLEDLYYGEFSPASIPSSNNESYQRTISQLAHLEEILSDTLSGKDKTKFLDFVNTYDELNGITACDQYIDGIRCGARLMLELFLVK